MTYACESGADTVKIMYMPETEEMLALRDKCIYRKR